MRLRTIITLPGADLAEKKERLSEWAAQTIAWHLPKKVAYWAFIRMGVDGIGDDIPTDLSFMDVLDRLTVPDRSGAE